MINIPPPQVNFTPEAPEPAPEIPLEAVDQSTEEEGFIDFSGLRGGNSVSQPVLEEAVTQEPDETMMQKVFGEDEQVSGVVEDVTDLYAGNLPESFTSGVSGMLNVIDDSRTEILLGSTAGMAMAAKYPKSMLAIGVTEVLFGIVGSQIDAALAGKDKGVVESAAEVLTGHGLAAGLAKVATKGYSASKGAIDGSITKAKIFIEKLKDLGIESVDDLAKIGVSAADREAAKIAINAQHAASREAVSNTFKQTDATKASLFSKRLDELDVTPEVKNETLQNWLDSGMPDVSPDAIVFDSSSKAVKNVADLAKMSRGKSTATARKIYEAGSNLSKGTIMTHAEIEATSGNIVRNVVDNYKKPILQKNRELAENINKIVAKNDAVIEMTDTTVDNTLNRLQSSLEASGVLGEGVANKKILNKIEGTELVKKLKLRKELSAELASLKGSAGGVKRSSEIESELQQSNLKLDDIKGVKNVIDDLFGAFTSDVVQKGSNGKIGTIQRNFVQATEDELFKNNPAFKDMYDAITAKNAYVSAKIAPLGELSDLSYDSKNISKLGKQFLTNSTSFKETRAALSSISKEAVTSFEDASAYEFSQMVKGTAMIGGRNLADPKKVSKALADKEVYDVISAIRGEEYARGIKGLSGIINQSSGVFEQLVRSATKENADVTKEMVATGFDVMMAKFTKHGLAESQGQINLTRMAARELTPNKSFELLDGMMNPVSGIAEIIAEGDLTKYVTMRAIFRELGVKPLARSEFEEIFDEVHVFDKDFGGYNKFVPKPDLSRLEGFEVHD